MRSCQLGEMVEWLGKWSCQVKWVVEHLSRWLSEWLSDRVFMPG